MPCTNVTIEEPESDESSIEITNFDVSVENRNEAVVSYTINNKVTSGDGANKGAAVSVMLNGNEVDSVATAVGAGGSVDQTTRITGISSGQNEICVNASGGPPEMGNL